MPVLRSIAVGTPANRVSQSEAREAAKTFLPRLAARPKLLDVFDNAMIDTRYLARPLEWYLEPHGFAEKNAVYVEETLALCERLTLEAMEKAGIRAADIGAVVFVSSTGISTPSLESILMERLGIARHAVRLPLWGLGCAGGAQGLARSADLVRAGYKNVLFLAAEFCSLTLVAGDETSSNFVATALFADGAAALILGPDDGSGPALMRVHGSFSTLIENSKDIMGWDVVESGLKVRFSQDIPSLVRQMMSSNVQEALEVVGWTQDELQEYVVHPGGAKVIEAYEESLGLPAGRLVCSRRVLREYGNMSSSTVLFVLNETLRRGAHGKGLLSAMGPGFCAEHVLVDFGE
ncbi:type III polyketide synthase [Deinococcus ruber]|uniref:Chalcone synthase n=1 Tax=Deinococcus ruber TaxID=1848197 RepID=A0A918F2U2_9DEIO|nr:3-oxoacyl-[acyl-carrier-protein] synthase III C-terminal domain-containing protein [Deinococcus ruber]GGR02135.1 chalcone synthase [Deinococcus ruber]